MNFTKTQNTILLTFGAILPLAIGATIWFGYYAIQARTIKEQSTNLTKEDYAYCHGLQDTFREDRRLFCYNESIAEILSYKYKGYSPENCAQTPLFESMILAQQKKMDERCKAIINLNDLDAENPFAESMRDKNLKTLEESLK